MDDSVPIYALVCVSLPLLLFFIIMGVTAYYVWLDYQRIPPFLGKMFPYGPIDHQGFAETRAGKYFLKLFSLDNIQDRGVR